MKRVLVLTEGQTEERFIKDVLQPALWACQISLEPKTVTTKRVIGGASSKGGGDFSKILADIKRLLHDSDAVAVTTLFDFYGFPQNIPGAHESLFRDIEALTLFINGLVADRRFRAYLQRHEFEAFLFVDPQITADVAEKPHAGAALLAQRRQFAGVEDINLDPALAPSKRLQGSKPLVGSIASQRIGLDRLREACPRFADWVMWLSRLAAPI